MPTLPSSSSTVPQRRSPGSGSKTERRNAGTPRRAAAAIGGGAGVDAEGDAPVGGEGGDDPPGPAPDVEHRVGHGREQGPFDGVGLGVPAVDREGDAFPAVGHQRGVGARRPVRPRSATALTPRPRSPARGPRPPRRRGRGATRRPQRRSVRRGRRGRRSRRRPTCRRRCGPAAARYAGRGRVNRACWRAPVSARLIGTPAKARGWGRRSPSAHHPPSVAGPRTASWSASAPSAASRSAAVTWGVSMPISTAGPDVAAAHAAVSRRSSGPVPWPTTSTPGGHHGPGRPSSARTTRPAHVTRAPRPACRPAPPRRASPPRPGCTAGSGGS